MASSLLCTLLLVHWCSGWIVRPPINGRATQRSLSSPSSPYTVATAVDGEGSDQRSVLVGRRSFFIISSSSVLTATAATVVAANPLAARAAAADAPPDKRGEAYNAMLARKAAEKSEAAERDAAAEAARYSDMRTTALGLRYSVVRRKPPPPGSSLKKPVRGQSVLCQYTLSVGGFPGDEKWEKVDGSTGFMKPPGGFGFYAGVGQAKFLGEPVVGFDLTVLSMEEGEARRVIVPPSLGFGARGVGGLTGSKIPPGTTLFFEVELVEVGDEPLFDDDQRAFLAQNPLPEDRLLPLPHTSSSSSPPPPETKSTAAAAPAAPDAAVPDAAPTPVPALTPVAVDSASTAGSVGKAEEANSATDAAATAATTTGTPSSGAQLW